MKHKFIVTIEFADKITDDNEINEIANNIANALKTEATNYGLVPDDSETYTKKIEVETVKAELPNFSTSREL